MRAEAQAEILNTLLELFATDPDLDEVLINGTRGMVLWSKGAAKLQEPLKSLFSDDLQMIDWLQDLAHESGLRLDPLQPFVGGMLKGNEFRWHCILPPVATDGPLFSLRRHRFQKIFLRDFADPTNSIPLVVGALERGAPILIAGPTGSGKTSFLHALLTEYCHCERVFVIEMVAEIPAASPSWVRLVQRGPNIEGEGTVSLRRIIAESLRMLPQRLVVGEIRGDEAAAFLQAQSTGHRGSIATIHAGSVEGAVARLFALAEMPLQPGQPCLEDMADLVVVRLSPHDASGRPTVSEARRPDWRLLLAEKQPE